MSGIAGVWNLDARQSESPLRDGRALLFDGRLDNQPQLLAELSGRGITSSSSDSAVILEAFRQWGCECPAHLNGEFRLAIFDSDRRQLILARDPVGCKPLYYWTNGRTFVFGSEIKTILAHPEVRCKPDKDLIADYFVRDRLPYEDYGETFFEDIHAVLPGQRLTVSNGGVTSKTFWDFDPRCVVRLSCYAEYAERLRELMFQAVLRRLRTVHPVTIAVSGGLDSSIVLCIADQLRKDGAITTPLLPISLTGSASETTEETHSLALLESTTQLRIERVAFGSPGDRADLDNAAWHSESPRFDDGWCAQRPLFRRAHAQGASTVLSGHWSDQLSFATGYLSDLFVRFKWREIARHLDEYSRWFVDAEPQYFQRRFRRELAFTLTSHRLRRWIRPFVREKGVAAAEGFAPDVAARIERSRPALPRPRCHSAHARDIYQVVRAKARRLQFEADAKLAAGCGIEWTSPFLDRDLIAYLMAVPGEIQNRGGVPRALLRDAMRGIVPDDILRRRWHNEDGFVRVRVRDDVSRSWSLDAAVGLGLVRPPFPVREETLELIGLESWSRVFFSDRLSAHRQPRDGVSDRLANERASNYGHPTSSATGRPREAALFPTEAHRSR
jgi:asparagine synthase (glutamine-hydrolysing)